MIRYTIKKIESKDELTDLYDIWKNNLPLFSTTEKKYMWFYKENQFQQGDCYLLYHEGIDKKAVGAAGIGYRQIKLNGHVSMVGLLVDLAVDKKHRTLGPAMMLQRKACQCLPSNISMIYVLPNKEARAVYKRIGYKKVAEIQRYAKIVKYEPFIKRFIHIKHLCKCLSFLVDTANYLKSRETWKCVPKGYQSSISNNIDLRFDVLWERASVAFQCIGVRDSKFLNWRYRKCPEREYKFYTLADQKGQLVGYVVFYIKDSVVYVDDILASDQLQQIDFLLSGFLKYVKKLRVNSVSMGISPSDQNLLRVISRYRFKPRPEFKDVLVYSKEKAIVEKLKKMNWYLTYGDEDNT